jgi:hypothetical protein
MIELLRAVLLQPLGRRRRRLAVEDSQASAPPQRRRPGSERSVVTMQRALTELLDSRSSSRSALRHLAALEQQLKAGGDQRFDRLSAASLQTMLRQLDNLIEPPPPVGAQVLMTSLLEALERKRPPPPRTGPPDQISSFFVDHKLEVREFGPSVLGSLAQAQAAQEDPERIT